jgi:hypothetical protein
MPTFAADVLPDASGRNLGNPSQRWNATVQNLNVSGASSFSPVSRELITPGGVIFAYSDQVTANANTTNYQQLMAGTVVANSINQKNKVIAVDAGGSWQLQTGQAPTMSLQVAFGGLSGLTVYLGQTGVSFVGPPLRWQIRVTVLVNAAGTAGVLVSSGVGVIGQSGAAALVFPYGTQPTVSPIDLTNDFSIIVLGAFSTNTSPANILTQQLMVITKGN